MSLSSLLGRIDISTDVKEIIKSEIKRIKDLERLLKLLNELVQRW